MKKENLIVIAVIGGIILLGLGFGLGLDWAQKEIKKAKVESPLAVLLGSKVIGSIDAIASGEVKEISGRNLTLSKEGDTFTIPVSQEARINRIVPPKKISEPPQPTTVEEIGFEEIKIGDKVNIVCKLKADASLEGVDVTVLPY